jgi:predicted dienelactone hydrolase
MSKPFTEAAGLPINAATPFTAFTSVVLPVPGRPVPLELKVSAPVLGMNLPVILFSHGHGGSNFLASLHGYGPLADFWAAHGFVVIQPTHLDAMELGLRETPAGPLFCLSRAEDMRHILDHLDEIETTVPGLAGRLDRDKIAAVGHSLGGNTVGLLCGMELTDAEGKQVNLADARVKVGVLMGAPGRGEHLDGPLAERFPLLTTASFATMSTPALVIAGDNDFSPAFSSHMDWRFDAYTQSPEPKCLLTFSGAGHMLGGISGYDSSETSDENPERVAAVRALVWAYLRKTLFSDDSAWQGAVAALEGHPNPLAQAECK